MFQKSLFSIITVNLNDVEGLQKTMTSVFNQTWQNFEFIVIDGGSTDGSKEYLEEHNGQIDYWVSEKDSGIYNAMNKGIKVATGEYLLFLNSGDHLYQELVLEEIFTSLDFYDLIYFNIEVVSDKTRFIKRSPIHLIFSYFLNDTLPHQATFIKASLFQRVGFYDEDLKIVSDWKFFLESICKYNATYLKVENILSTHYLNGISAVPENWSIILDERNQVLESGFKAFVKDCRELLHSRQELAELRYVLSKLRKSKKIQLMIKLGLLNKF